MKPDEPHKHKLEPHKVESRTFKVEEYQGQKTESLASIDVIKVWKCKCGYQVAYDLERRTV